MAGVYSVNKAITFWIHYSFHPLMLHPHCLLRFLTNMNRTELDNSTSSRLLNHCARFPLSNYLFTVYMFALLLLVPLFSYVLLVGYRRGKSSKLASHLDVLTYNAMALEILTVLSLFLYCWGVFSNTVILLISGIGGFSVISCGQTLLHVLACVERFIAVVHPVTYMSLKQSGDVKIRNVSVLCVWMSCAVATGLLFMTRGSDNSVVSYVFLHVCLVIVCFCSVAVLRVLLRQSPGDTLKKRIDPSKRRAFRTIMMILGVLVLRFIGVPARGQLFHLMTFESCWAASVVVWFNLPSSLVLPLLFLQKTGKLPGSKQKTESR